MTASDKTYALIGRASSYGIELTFAQANILRRAQLTLRRWYELECGDGNDYASWSIERDEQTGIPRLVTYPHQGELKSFARKVPDREAGARKRVAEVCTEAGLYFYHQTDPRGCALYVSREPLPDNNYTRGLAVY
jgi:hypothetical protein